MKFKDFTLMHKFILIAVLGIYLLISYWLFWPCTPIVVEPIKIHNINNEVYPKEALIYSMNMHKKMALPALITKQLVNDFIITYSPIVGNMPVGKHVKKVKLKIPRSAEPGKYRLRWEGIYKINPLRDISVVVWSEPFQILAKRPND